MNNLIYAAISRTRTALMIFVLLIVSGAVTYFKYSERIKPRCASTVYLRVDHS